MTLGNTVMLLISSAQRPIFFVVYHVDLKRLFHENSVAVFLLEFKRLTKQRKAHAAGLENESSQQLPLNRLAIGVE